MMDDEKDILDLAGIVGESNLVSSMELIQADRRPSPPMLCCHSDKASIRQCS
jgi:hypothetical protein